MAKTAAERQAEYRARKLEKKPEHGGDMAQLNVFISAAHRNLLTQAARRHGMTQAEMLAQIIEASPFVQVVEQDKEDFLSGRLSGFVSTGG